MHCEERGDTFEPGAVADAGRDGDHRHGSEPTNNARQCAFHASNTDHCVGRGDVVQARQQPVEAGDADIGDQPRCEAVGT